MRSKIRQEEIRKVLVVCKGRWLSAGVPEDRVEEMSEELEQHLRGSLEDGQSVEDVVGEDVFEFAEGWADLNLPSKPVSHEVLEMLSATSIFTFLYILAVHLWQGSANLQVGWNDMAFLAIAASVFSGLFVWLRRPAGESSDKGESVWDIYPYWLQAALSVFGLLAILAPNSRLLPPAIEGLSYTWSWPMTGAFLVASPILLGLKKVVGGGPGYSWERRDYEEINRRAYEYPDLDDKGRIGLVVKDAVFHWKMQTRIPADRAEEMGEELEQHLWDAVGEDKTVESVVGNDVEAFAESWAEEDPPPTSLADRVVEGVFAVSAFFTIAPGLVHLTGWTLYVQVIWFPLLLLLGVSAWLVQGVVERVRHPQTGSLRKSWLLTAAVGLLLVGISAGLAFAIFGVKEAVPLLESLRWPWYATLTSATISVAMLFLWLKE